MKKKIGMLVAVEMDAVLSIYGEAKESLEYPGYSVLCYENESYILYVLRSGAGEIAAAAGVQFLISVLGVEMIINFGVVGGLTPEMTLSKVCIVEKVVHYDFDTSEFDNCEVGRYMNYPSVYIPANEALVRRAVELEPELKKVVCASGDKFVGDPDKKRALNRDFGADICEMEAAGIIITCDRNGIPCLMIKSVSDSIEGGAEEFAREILRASEVCLRVADRIIKEL